MLSSPFPNLFSPIYLEDMKTIKLLSLCPLKNIIPSPAAIESHYYSIRVQLPRRQHGHTSTINDFVTYEFQRRYVNA